MLKELGKLFGSENRVKILRYFLAHPDEQISLEELSKRVKVKNLELKKESKNLAAINFLNEIILIEDYEVKTGKKGNWKIKIKQKKQAGLELNKNYVFANSLANLLLDFRFIDRKELLKDFQRYGKIKLLCLGGVFMQDDESKLDLLLAGDALDKAKIDEFIKKLEADFGTEIRYAVFESEEFRYRVNMFDRLIKDFWKRPHEKIVERIETRP
jgi:hypothetical protein